MEQAAWWRWGKVVAFSKPLAALRLRALHLTPAVHPRMSERRAGEGSDRAADGFVRRVG
jgi:hypothetical protein